MAFRDYVNGLGGGGSIVRATFIADVQSDTTMPDVVDWPELESYLRTRSSPGSQESLDEARSVWQNYELIQRV
jgi:hypothetical protein